MKHRKYDKINNKYLWYLKSNLELKKKNNVCPSIL